jgi:peptide/nickel transport system permease protein
VSDVATQLPRRVRRTVAAPGRGWAAFAAERLLGLVAIALLLIFGTFMMVRLIPGDPASYIGGINASAEQIEQIRTDLGLDKPFFEQLATYTSNLFTGDLGVSYQTREPVTEVISANLGPSLELAAVSLAFVLIVSIVGGMLIAHLTREHRRPRTEVAFTAVSSVVGAFPDYLLATFLTALFALWLPLFPVAGADSLSHLVLPALALSLPPAAILMRIVRVETLNVLAQEYIRTARSKRLSGALIYRRHVLPNVVTAALTIGGILFAALVGGAVVVENVFARPGLGSALVDAVLSRDYAVLQILMLLLGLTVVVVNTVIDVLLGIVDPRTRTHNP